MTRGAKGEQVEPATQRMATMLEAGLLLVDTRGDVVWMDERIRRRIDGGLSRLKLPLRRQDQRSPIDCFLTTAQVEVDGKTQPLCVMQMVAPEESTEYDTRRIVDAVEAVMAEPAWFTRAFVEKLKASLQAVRPANRAADLERLTAREREILGLVCEGRSDAEMARLLKLSQNTVRNHLASLFRKIGVNRRSAAVIWARERAITKHDIAELSSARDISERP